MLQRSVQSKPDEKIFIELLFYEHFLLNQNGFIVLENVLRQKKRATIRTKYITNFFPFEPISNSTFYCLSLPFSLP
jgi:hypothetical protein